MTKITVLFAFLFGVAASADAQETIPLYSGEIPNAIEAPDEESVRDPSAKHTFKLKVSRPTLSVYLPDPQQANGTAVIICPGGGYTGLSVVKEGSEVARAFNEMGVAAFVLKYRTPSDRYMTDKTTGPLQDAQQALRVVRRNAKKWRVDPGRVGIVGFSAGGHLASTAGTHFDRPVVATWKRDNLRPDFMVLVYPVISFTERQAHPGSRANLLGPEPPEALIRRYSNELQVTAETPSTFLVHAGDDRAVPVGNSIAFYQALHAQGVSAQLIVYPEGGHGFGLHNPTTPDSWIERCRDWLASRGLLTAQDT
ncbi:MULTISPECIES: alpha/beta hydrolase [unclassified Microbulbifer]|uniref:alpha/beta hydrolase n=1 Tax=unclassified Microbulbifer TaxID=2619833 RepID=UPI0027E42C57|nr:MULTISPECIES: alpha/beta hydrolase [unclassified Microbulbifer]